MHVRIPAGVDTGTRLRLRGEGESGTMGGPAATSTWRCRSPPHPIFSRQEQDLHYRGPTFLY